MGATDLVRSAYEHFIRDDLHGMLEGMADSVVLHVPAPLPFEGDHVGIGAVRAVLVDQYGAILKDLDAEVLDIYEESEGRVLVLIRFRGSGQGDDFDRRSLHIHRVRDGEIVEIWFQPIDEETTSRFWSSIPRP